MTDTWGAFSSRLEEALSRYDRQQAAALAHELIGRVHHGEIPPPRVAAGILGSLRKKRLLDLVEQLAETFRRAGMEEPKIRRLQAQALIDQGRVDAAVDTLQLLAAATATANPVEHAEAVGLLGRVYKQLYVNAANADPSAARSPVVQRYLRRSLREYQSVYRADPTHLWHGINAVAVACRGEADGVSFEEPFDPRKAAREILRGLEARRRAREVIPAWDLATALECCVALGAGPGARRWLAAYVAHVDADAFELNSTLRQLKEVWRLGARSPPGATILPILEAELAKRQGGRVDLAPEEVAERRRGLEGGKGAARSLEKTFGERGVVTYQWYRRGLERFQWVARVCDRTGRSIGTGFLLKGAHLDPRLGDELVLVTNAHVVSNDIAVRASEDALDPSQATARFDAWPKGKGAREFGVRSLVWTSPPGQLDATVLRLDPAPPAGETYPVASVMPALAKRPLVYVIGHPRGGGLSIALNDNLLIDQDDRRLHYRAPTEPGSSGSPVFDEQWDLIGLHHAGDREMKRLHGEGTYQANEGIVFRAIAVAMGGASIAGPAPLRGRGASRKGRSGRRRPGR
ncbi:MAG TPA: serine protease [Anaeromyxobacteraceae bacterium]